MRNLLLLTLGVLAASAKTCNGPRKTLPSTYWLADIHKYPQNHGYAPYANTTTYPIWRNVLDYGASNTGSGDQTAHLQHALDAISQSTTTNSNMTENANTARKGQGVTRLPAQVYMPSGTYQLNSTLELRAGTVVVGDPLNPPLLKAASGFRDETLVKGYDASTGDPTTSFMTLVKNVDIDTGDVAADKKIVALQWGVAQGAGLTNVRIYMPSPGSSNSTSGHTGINLDGGSTIAVTDVQIHGGRVGIDNSNQQVNFKGIAFNGCRTGFKASGGHTALLQDVQFNNCKTGVDLTDNAMGSLILLDSTCVKSGPVIRFYDSSNDTGSRNSQVLIENLKCDGKDRSPIAVDSDGKTRLSATRHVDTWAWGTFEPGTYEKGKSFNTSRPEVLLSGGKYFTRAQPTYAEYSPDQFVNVKAVNGHSVKGDGLTDDSKSLNAILADNAVNCKVTYFPYGVYVVKDTLLIPEGTRIVGEAWAVIAGAGHTFKDPQTPKPVVQIGHPGDVGVVEIQEMRFTVSEVLPGAKILEINVAGQQPGDVSLWNTIATVGGTADTSISRTCDNQDPSTCMAAYMVLHLTKTSSAYLENFWGWTADHNLDNGTDYTIISTGRGILIESNEGTWLTGTGSEHHWLYDYNFHNAQNVFAGLLQSESPYMQGTGAIKTVPAPWTVNTTIGDPDFTWCAADDQKCRSALATNVDGGKDVLLYNSAAWAFFNGTWEGDYSGQCAGSCQSNMMRVTAEPENLVWYSVNTRKTDVMVLDGRGDPREGEYKGGWEGVLLVYGAYQ